METETIENSYTIEDYRPDDKEQKLIDKWKRRFNLAERTRRPYYERDLRMHKLYRGYRDKTNYAYKTRIMPPIGFEVVETIKPRLTAARMRTKIFPMQKDDVGSPAIEQWEDLVNYQLDINNFNEKRTDVVDTMLKYGNGYAVLSWRLNGEDDGDPQITIWDKLLVYFDPQSTTGIKDSSWEILQSYKKKEKIEKEEKNRGDNKIYNENLKFVENKDNRADDPRRERYEIESLKMGQVDTGEREQDDTQTSTTDEKMEEQNVERWICIDHDTDEIIEIMNREVLVRQIKNPYLNINNGRIIFDLPCIRVPFSPYAIPILEPIETIIHEIADNRNQAMDNIVYNLDPIRKIRKGSGITEDDIRVAPGAVWELTRSDDVVIERGPGIDTSWIEKDRMLRGEIESSLALSEYVRGVPQSAQEPMGKVELLLMQTSIRFSQFVRQMETFMTSLVNAMIQMNQEFGSEEKVMRIMGDDDVEFKEFKSKKVRVDARVEIEPDPEKTPKERRAELMQLYEMLVVNDVPAEGADQTTVDEWNNKKRILQNMILKEFDLEQYEQELMGIEKKVDAEKQENVTSPVKQPKQQQVDMNEIPPIELQSIIPGAETPQTAPRSNIIQRLIQKVRGNV